MEYLYQFLVNFVATTIGVILAIILGRWYDKFKEGEEAESVKDKILIELNSIKVTMLGIRNGVKGLLLAPIKIPTYQGYVNSSKISLLDRYIWYNELLNLYKYLETYNSWQDIKTERIALSVASTTSDKDSLISKIDKSLTELEEIILGKLDDCEDAKHVGLINFLIAEMSVSNKTDLVKKRKKIEKKIRQ